MFAYIAPDTGGQPGGDLPQPGPRLVPVQEPVHAAIVPLASHDVDLWSNPLIKRKGEKSSLIRI